MGRPLNFTSTVAVARIEKILTALRSSATGLSVAGIAVATHMSERNAYTYVQHLSEKGHKRIYVRGWEPKIGRPGRPSPLYGAGNTKDAKRPPPMTGKQHTARRRKRREADPDLYAEYIAEGRARYWRSRGPRMEVTMVPLHFLPIIRTTTDARA